MIPVISELSSDEFEVGTVAIDGMDEDEFNPSVYYLLSPIPDLRLMYILGSVFTATRTGSRSDGASEVTSPFSAETSFIPNS